MRVGWSYGIGLNISDGAFYWLNFLLSCDPIYYSSKKLAQKHAFLIDLCMDFPVQGVYT